jgi:peroxiredoxin
MGWVAVMFFRGHWCPYCGLNVRAVIKAYDRMKALGAGVVAIMPETQEYAAKFKTEAGAPFPVLTDLDNGYALSLNLAIWLGAEIERLLSYLDMPSFHGNDGWVLPIPAAFVIGRDGMVRLPAPHGDRGSDRRSQGCEVASSRRPACVRALTQLGSSPETTANLHRAACASRQMRPRCARGRRRRRD